MSCLSCLVHSHMLVPAVTFSPQAPNSADHPGTARGSAPLGKVSEWIVLAFRCTVRFLPEVALLTLCSRVNLPDPVPSCCFETVTWVRPVSIHTEYESPSWRLKCKTHVQLLYFLWLPERLKPDKFPQAAQKRLPNPNEEATAGGVESKSTLNCKPYKPRTLTNVFLRIS